MAHTAQHDEESDHQYAMRLSEELNGGNKLPLSKAPEAEPEDYDSEDHFAYALQLQFGDSHNIANEVGEGSVPRPGPLLGSGAPRPEDSPWTMEENGPKSAHYHPETPNGTAFNRLADFIQHLKSVQCSTCGRLFFKSELDVSTILQNWKCGTNSLSCSIKCSTCSNTSCIACTPQPFASTSTITVRGKPQLSWCCNGGRLFLLWLLLCGIDEHYSAAKAKEAAEKKPESKPDKKKQKSNKRGRGGGVGFGGPSRSSMPQGMGYGSDLHDYEDDEDFHDLIPGSVAFGGQGHTLSFSPGQALFSKPGHTLSGHRVHPATSKGKAMSQQDREDQYMTTQFELIEALLPSFERESSFDFDPPEAVAEMLLHSKILHSCSELLRNDSLEDATKRRTVYQALFHLLRTLGAHHLTASNTIYGERPVRQEKARLLHWCWQKSSPVSEEKTSSLFSYLRNLAEQSALVLQGAKGNEQEFQLFDGQNLLLLCRQISELQAYLVANAHSVKDDKSVQPTLDIPALSEVPDKDIFATHKYGPSAKALSGTRTGRFKRLITEITTLKTGLPPGIFVRYAESRPDVLKFIIIGPAGTPYESGLFEFDCWCDGNFPDSPPLVHFKTTSGGRVGFNPNLYPEGKVCLSLLNTWQGQKWSSESTLLQVVVSIQAMILCEEPWYNEPGREMSYNSDATSSPSAIYNHGIRQQTVRVAMLEWIDKTPSLWKDVVDQHFTTNANKILETVTEWAKSKPPPSKYRDRYPDEIDEMLMSHPSLLGAIRGPSSHNSDLKPTLLHLQKTLKKYGATYVVPDISEPLPVEKPSNPPVSRFSSPFSPSPAPPPPPGHFPSSAYLPPPPTYTPAPPPSAHSGWFSFGPFAGAGHVLGENPAPAPAPPTNTTPGGGRGDTGRYETRSSTRGRGGPSINLDDIATFGGRGGRGSNRGGSGWTVVPPRGGRGSGRGASTDMTPPRGGFSFSYTQGRGRGTGGGPIVTATPHGPNMWPPDSFSAAAGRGGRDRGRGRGRGRGDATDPPRGGRGGRDGRT